MKTRVTVDILASGQPRAYADHRTHVRVEFEWSGYRSSSDPLVPCFMSEDAARRRLADLQCGFVGRSRSEVSWPETYLDWIKSVDGRPASEIIEGGDPSQIVASVWEFHTSTPFTD